MRSVYTPAVHRFKLQGSKNQHVERSLRTSLLSLANPALSTDERSLQALLRTSRLNPIAGPNGMRAYLRSLSSAPIAAAAASRCSLLQEDPGPHRGLQERRNRRPLHSQRPRCARLHVSAHIRATSTPSSGPLLPARAGRARVRRDRGSLVLEHDAQVVRRLGHGADVPSRPADSRVRRALRPPRATRAARLRDRLRDAADELPASSIASHALRDGAVGSAGGGGSARCGGDSRRPRCRGAGRRTRGSPTPGGRRRPQHRLRLRRESIRVGRPAHVQARGRV